MLFRSDNNQRFSNAAELDRYALLYIKHIIIIVVGIIIIIVI